MPNQPNSVNTLKIEITLFEKSLTKAGNSGTLCRTILQYIVITYITYGVVITQQLFLKYC